MSIKKLDKTQLKALAKQMNLPIGRDFHTLDTDERIALEQILKISKYKKPATASGSVMRSFYDYLNKG